MREQHEYAILHGPNRSRIGRILSLAAASISSAATFIALEMVDLAKKLGIEHNLPPIVLSLVSAGAVYAFLYYLFDQHAWRWTYVAKLLRVPDVSGSWRCEGRTLNADGSVQYAWSGNVQITQSWDKIRVRLKTDQSASNSIAAALYWDEIDGYRLLYHYANEPRIGAPALTSHRGFADLLFSDDRKSVIGEYFNGQGRNTFGTMQLTRENS